MPVSGGGPKGGRGVSGDTFDRDDFDRMATRAVRAAGLRDVKWVVNVLDQASGPYVLRGVFPCGRASDGLNPMLRICTPRRFGEPQWVSLSHMGQAWARTGRLCVDVEASVRWVLARMARDAHLAERHETSRRVIASDTWSEIKTNHMQPDEWLRVDEEARGWAEGRRVAADSLRSDIASAREAIRVLLGDAGLDGLGDLTTADGRSVVDIVRRGMGVGP